MEPRFNMAEQNPQIYRELVKLDAQVRHVVDRTLGELVKIQASQINGCAFCLDMHTKDAREAGGTEQQIYALSAWQEASFFTDRERAVLALTEAVTVIQDGHVPDEIYDRAAQHFGPPELTGLIWGIITINAWNRIAITSRTEPGSYQPELAR